MQRANDYRQKTVVSLTDQIKGLQGEVSRIKAEKAEHDGSVRARKDELEALDQQGFAAKSSHAALLKSHEAELEAKKDELEHLKRSQSIETESYAQTRNYRQVEVVNLDLAIAQREDRVKELVIQETGLIHSISRLSTDKVLALKDTAAALQENQRAVKRLSDARVLIAQAEKDYAAGEAKRKAETDTRQAWQDRLEIRENDLNVLAARLKPEFVKVFGEQKIHAKVFGSSK